MVDKIVELLKNNSNTLDVTTHNTPSKITFIGSVNYEDIAKKIAELFSNTTTPIIQISEEKKGVNRTISKVSSPKEIPASLVIKHLQLTIKSIENAVEKEVTTEFQAILKTGEFVNDTAENDWIESAKHLIRMGRLSIEEPEIFWIKNPKG
ncbi:MAG: hypothetical protein KBB75_01020 [Candidatus Pacebacteria bacterium]|jgi:hypothetical protein|nr:hypothetical protein [Candidatus Paceibacterota bacterium]